MKTGWGRSFDKSVPVLRRSARVVMETMAVIVGLFGTVIAAPLSHAAAAVRHVPHDYPTIQAAINASSGADEIVLDAGVYGESIDFMGKAITVRSTDPNDSRVVEATVINGDQRDKAVFFGHGEGKGSVLSGVTVQKVHVKLSYGGVYCSGSSPTIEKCIIKENQGGGIYCSNSSAAITDCTIQENGDGIGCWESSLTVSRCVISENQRYGIYCGENSSLTLNECLIMENLCTGLSFVDSTGTVRDCTISGNNGGCTMNGGGMSCLSNSSPTIVNCLISGNSSAAGGGIACDWGCSPVISACTITGNSAVMAGGGILCSGNASPVLTNCVISRNSVSDGSGGGIYSEGAGITLPYPPYLAIPKPVIMNCTITQNSASGFGGGICSFLSSPVITNCILWGDFPHEISGKVKTITFSDIQSGNFGPGNIKDDPLFVSPAAEDCHLQPDSPCINAGTSRGAPPEDREGHPRDKRPDMGAYEYTLPSGTEIIGRKPFEKGFLPGYLPKTFNSHLHKAIKSFRKGVYRENPFSKGFSP